jgi:hypothetical protein
MPTNVQTAFTHDPGPPASDAGTLDVGAFTPRQRQQVSGPGLRTFLNIADRWGLTEAERLRVVGLPGRSTYHGWAAKARAGGNPTLPLDTLLRISAVLGVFKALQIIFTSDADGQTWLRSPNRAPVFGGQPPLALLVSGSQDGIMTVRRYLDAWRGGMFAAPVSGFDAAMPALTDDDIVFV